MFRAIVVDSFVLLLSCSITTGALGSPGLLSPYSIITNNNSIAQHHLTNNNPYIFQPLKQLIQVQCCSKACRS